MKKSNKELKIWLQANKQEVFIESPLWMTLKRLSKIACYNHLLSHQAAEI